MAPLKNRTNSADNIVGWISTPVAEYDLQAETRQQPAPPEPAAGSTITCFLIAAREPDDAYPYLPSHVRRGFVSIIPCKCAATFSMTKCLYWPALLSAVITPQRRFRNHHKGIHTVPWYSRASPR
jgi:hypothetical protein